MFRSYLTFLYSINLRINSSRGSSSFSSPTLLGFGKSIRDLIYNKVAAMTKTYRDLGLECLVVLGGNGSQKTANLLSQEGLNVISLPKTIDNDIFGTDMTFGFQSAVDIATNAIDNAINELFVRSFPIDAPTSSCETITFESSSGIVSYFSAGI